MKLYASLLRLLLILKLPLLFTVASMTLLTKPHVHLVNYILIHSGVPVTIAIDEQCLPTILLMLSHPRLFDDCIISSTETFSPHQAPPLFSARNLFFVGYLRAVRHESFLYSCVLSCLQCLLLHDCVLSEINIKNDFVELT